MFYIYVWLNVVLFYLSILLWELVHVTVCKQGHHISERLCTCIRLLLMYSLYCKFCKGFVSVLSDVFGTITPFLGSMTLNSNLRQNGTVYMYYEYSAFSQGVAVQFIRII